MLFVKQNRCFCKDVENLKAENDKLGKEIATVRHGVDNWRSEFKNINGQILIEVNKKDIESILTKESVVKN